MRKVYSDLDKTLANNLNPSDGKFKIKTSKHMTIKDYMKLLPSLPDTHECDE